MDMNIWIAKNLKMIREEKNLSLDSVSKLTGVSKSMLGQIERGTVNPTISVLWKISCGLKTSFTTLIAATRDDSEVIKKDEISPVSQADGKYINYPVFMYDENRRFETYRIVVSPGGFLEAEPHISGTEEYITVFRGEVKIIAGDREFLLKEGDSVRFRADIHHSYWNNGLEEVQLSMIIFYN